MYLAIGSLWKVSPLVQSFPALVVFNIINIQLLQQRSWLINCCEWSLIPSPKMNLQIGPTCTYSKQGLWLAGKTMPLSLRTICSAGIGTNEIRALYGCWPIVQTKFYLTVGLFLLQYFNIYRLLCKQVRKWRALDTALLVYQVHSTSFSIWPFSPL